MMHRERWRWANTKYSAIKSHGNNLIHSLEFILIFECFLSQSNTCIWVLLLFFVDWNNWNADLCLHFIPAPLSVELWCSIQLSKFIKRGFKEFFCRLLTQRRTPWSVILNVYTQAYTRYLIISLLLENFTLQESLLIKFMENMITLNLFVSPDLILLFCVLHLQPNKLTIFNMKDSLNNTSTMNLWTELTTQFHILALSK